jgi:hypothetical protein
MIADEPPVDQDAPADPHGAVVEPAMTEHRPPRVWTVFVAYPIVLSGMLLAQAAGVAVVAAWYAAQGGNLQQLKKELPALVAAPAAFMIFAGLAQLVVALGAIIPARLSREPFLSRLGLVKPSLPGWSYPLLALGTSFRLQSALCQSISWQSKWVQIRLWSTCMAR